MKPRALVTGASRGIGAAIAELLAEAGHPVVLGYRGNHDAAKAVQARIVAAGGTAELAAFDVADAGAAEQAIDRLLEDPRPIGIVVNNAGITKDAPFAMLGPDKWQDVIDTSLTGFYNVTKPLVKPMIKAHWGRIITISSAAGVTGNRGQVAYSAAKAGLIGATKALAQELARRNITVNAVAPGFIETDMTKDLPSETLTGMIPMARLGQPREVAELVAFLASDRAAYITGQVIGINGGLI